MTIGKVDKSVKIWTEIYDKIDSYIDGQLWMDWLAMHWVKQVDIYSKKNRT